MATMANGSVMYEPMAKLAIDAWHGRIGFEYWEEEEQDGSRYLMWMGTLAHGGYPLGGVVHIKPDGIIRFNSSIGGEYDGGCVEPGEFTIAKLWAKSRYPHKPKSLLNAQVRRISEIVKTVATLASHRTVNPETRKTMLKVWSRLGAKADDYRWSEVSAALGKYAATERPAIVRLAAVPGKWEWLVESVDINMEGQWHQSKLVGPSAKPSLSLTTLPKAVGKTLRALPNNLWDEAYLSMAQAHDAIRHPMTGRWAMLGAAVCVIAMHDIEYIAPHNIIGKAGKYGMAREPSIVAWDLNKTRRIMAMILRTDEKRLHKALVLVRSDKRITNSTYRSMAALLWDHEMEHAQGDVYTVAKAVTDYQAELNRQARARWAAQQEQMGHGRVPVVDMREIENVGIGIRYADKVLTEIGDEQLEGNRKIVVQPPEGSKKLPATWKFMSCLDDYLEESRNMNHCVATYWREGVQSRVIATWHVDEGGERATVMAMVRNGKVVSIVQSFGPNNSQNKTASMAVKIAARTFSSKKEEGEEMQAEIRAHQGEPRRGGPDDTRSRMPIITWARDFPDGESADVGCPNFLGNSEARENAGLAPDPGNYQDAEPVERFFQPDPGKDNNNEIPF